MPIALIVYSIVYDPVADDLVVIDRCPDDVQNRELPKRKKSSPKYEIRAVHGAVFERIFRSDRGFAMHVSA